MTMLPVDSWNVKARPDLDPYELNTVDPVNGETWALEDHHLWRRSFGKDFREAWWVELEDGTVVPNRVALSNDTHRAVTENRARIVWIDGVFYYHVFGDDLALARPLYPQPGPASAPGELRSATETSEPMQTTVTGEEVPHAHVVNEQGVEVQCDKCKGRGKYVKRERSPTEPQTAERKKVTWSVRVPKDEREDGYDVLDTNVENCVDLLADANLIRDRNKGANYYTLVFVLAYFQQNFNPEAFKAQEQGE